MATEWSEVVGRVVTKGRYENNNLLSFGRNIQNMKAITLTSSIQKMQTPGSSTGTSVRFNTRVVKWTLNRIFCCSVSLLLAEHSRELNVGSKQIGRDIKRITRLRFKSPEPIYGLYPLPYSRKNPFPVLLIHM